jgi:hypothetical protein
LRAPRPAAIARHAHQVPRVAAWYLAHRQAQARRRTGHRGDAGVAPEGHLAPVRAALFRSRVYLRLLRPGLSEVLAPLPPADGMLRPAFDTLTTAIDQFLDTTQCAA